MELNKSGLFWNSTFRIPALISFNTWESCGKSMDLGPWLCCLRQLTLSHEVRDRDTSLQQGVSRFLIHIMRCGRLYHWCTLAAAIRSEESLALWRKYWSRPYHLTLWYRHYDQTIYDLRRGSHPHDHQVIFLQRRHLWYSNSGLFYFPKNFPGINTAKVTWWWWWW